MPKPEAPAIHPPLPVRLERHREALAGCRRCALAPGIRPIAATPARPRAMLVGQAPGKTEAVGGRPFAGAAGRTLFRWLARAGVDEGTAREHLYIGAVTRCYPGPSPSGRGDRVPTPAERARCRPWLDAELDLLRPSLLVTVGRLALEAVLGAMPLDQAVGRLHELRYAGGRAAVVPLPHPSGASSWIHAAEHQALLDRALGLLRSELARAGVPVAPSVACAS